MEMEMKARDDIEISQDLTPPISPLVFSLHDSFLNSHCSSCFNPLKSESNRSFSCPNCSCINYCSQLCLASDSAPHASECKLFNYKQNFVNDSTDLRVSLRLLNHFQSAGGLQFSNRIGGLLIADLEKVLEEGGELAEKIKHEAMLMSSVREEGQLAKGLKSEMLILWGVLRNSVEIQLSEFGPIGVGIYGPEFSWFNHSCVPNASYRFQIEDLSEKDSSFDNLGFLVVPTGTGDTSDNMIDKWTKERTTAQGFKSNFGPRIIVRSIKPIKKGEEICITYTDILQPKDKRQLELWSKYRFICLCSRCSESPLNYVDYILTCDTKSLNSQDFTSIGASASSASKYEQLYNEIQEAIEEYTLNNNPKLCCDKIENILLLNFLSLHPIHNLSLTAYITLSSAYKFRFKISQNFDLNLARVSSAYSLLLSFSTYNLFLFEPSLISTISHFLLSTGETVVSIFYNQKLEISSSFNPLLNLNSNLDFESNGRQFVECVSILLSKCWPYLVQDNSYLKKIKSPIDFSWIGLKNNKNNVLRGNKFECFVCRFDSNMFFEEEMKCLYKLGIHCLIHGMYLANICFGPHHYLIDKVKTLFRL